MNTLRQAVHEYLGLRRNLGFELREAGKALLDFVTFMEQHRAPYITEALALAWAQQPANVQPAHWARRLSIVRGFARYRSATDPRTQIPSPALLPFQPKRARPYLSFGCRDQTAAAQVSRTAEIARVEATPARLALGLQDGYSGAMSLGSCPLSFACAIDDDAKASFRGGCVCRHQVRFLVPAARSSPGSCRVEAVKTYVFT